MKPLREWESLLLPLLEADEETVEQVENEISKETIEWVRDIYERCGE